MTIEPMPRLPNPLTPETIGRLMNERPAWDPSHPRSSLYRNLIERAFALMYPGVAKYDAIGKMIDPDPVPPYRIARQVEAINREMERNIQGETARDGGFDERPSGDGEVHVQSHTRDGGKTDVADYWRSRPGEGGSDSADAANAEDENTDGGIQAGADDAKPWRDRHNPELREAIAEFEQSAGKPDDGYEERHPKGALGRYQMTPGALKDIDWRNPDGTWTSEAGKHGVASDADFLKNPRAQEAAMDKLLDRYEEQANEKRLFDRVSQKIEGRVDGITVGEASIMAGVHVGGATGTAGYFEKIDRADGVSKNAPLTKEELPIETRMRKAQGIDYQRNKDR